MDGCKGEHELEDCRVIRRAVVFVFGPVNGIVKSRNRLAICFCIFLECTTFLKDRRNDVACFLYLLSNEVAVFRKAGGQGLEEGG